MAGRARAALVAAIILVAGCQSKLNVERTVDFDAGLDTYIDIDPPKYDQTLSITVTSDTPIDVYVYLKKDKEAAQRDAMLGKKNSSVVLAGKEKVQSDTLEAKVPAKEPAVVMIRSSSKAGTAKLKIVGK